MTKSKNLFRLDLVKAVVGRRLPEKPVASTPVKSEIRVFYDYLSDLEGKIHRAVAAQNEIERHTQEQVVDTLRALSNPVSARELANARSRLGSILMDTANEHARRWLDLREEILSRQDNAH